MNILPLIAFYFLNSHSQDIESPIDHEIAHSLAYVVQKFFLQRSSSFVLIMSSERLHTQNFFNDVISHLFGQWSNIKAQIFINNFEVNTSSPGERMYNILLVDSWESFLKMDPGSKVKDYDVNEFYYIFLQNRDKFHAEQLQRIFDYCWRNYIINVNVQVQKASGDIIVYTYFPFTAKRCRGVVPVEVNRFVNGTMKNRDLFPAKVSNMHNCTVRVATWNSPPYISLDRTKKGRNALGGFEGRLLKEISKMMNFSIEIHVPPENRGVISKNKTTGAIRMLQYREADLSLGCFWFSRGRKRVLTGSSLYHQISNAAVFLTNSSYISPISALWIPFERSAWLALVATFLVIFVILFGLVWFSEKYLATGGYHRNIWLDYIACTLGLSSLMFPRRHSARIFVMTWMIFALVIRTEYGAIIYHFIRNNLFRHTPKNLDEIVKLNYIIALHPTSYRALSDTSIFTDTGLTYVLLNNSYGDAMYKYMENHRNQRYLTISPVEFILHSLATSRKIGEMSIMSESLLTQNACIFFTKHSFLVDRVNVHIRHINTVGLMQGWYRSAMDLSYLKAKRPPMEVKIGHHELKDVYYFCGLLLVFSVLVFCMEILSVRCSFLRRVFQKV